MIADLILISGFLGSGKTTLLKNLLSLHKGKRIAVIQNEFAPSGVDGKELKLNDEGFKLVEINNGSVFCVCLLSNFIENITKLIEEYNPEIIYLEASGISDPISICELLNKDEISNKVRYAGAWCVVDALNFEKSAVFVQRAKHQVRVADKIILNKIDLVNETKIEDVIQKVKEINPFAEIEQQQFCNVQSVKLNQVTKIPTITTEDSRPEEIKTAVYRTTDIISEEKLNIFLKELTAISIRAKGFVRVANNQFKLFHLTYNNFEIIPLDNYTGSCEIIAFGEQMSLKTLRELFQKNK
ncbi:CobW family GTP-binding protein [Lutibacter sp. TH_r2]|uniref:CobW family GTP-binding protein n=1 Tax=Lutibacter sp. TH_r2 TaxID=3082083 RepID=UPI002953F3BD|nr:CobW family GTP-binding protein [Lutibacter sp. TH_r2]MDV7185946.1 CobW family GTP-binding protein [Lutibacter sp. TH_r2]